MKKLNTLTLLLSVVLLHACTPKTECDKAKWHKYAIEAYYVPNYVYVAKAERSEDPSKLYWNLWFSRSEESSITEKTNKELFEKIAREHGETGVGFYAFPPMLPCLYGAQKIEVAGYNKENETSLSHIIFLSSYSIEPFIQRGYKTDFHGIWTPIDLSLESIINYDYFPFPMEGRGFLLSCDKSDVEGKFDRIKLRVVLKDGKTLRTDMPL